MEALSTKQILWSQAEGFRVLYDGSTCRGEIVCRAYFVTAEGERASADGWIRKGSEQTCRMATTITVSRDAQGEWHVRRIIPTLVRDVQHYKAFGADAKAAWVYARELVRESTKAGRIHDRSGVTFPYPYVDGFKGLEAA